jgi:cyclin-C
MNGARRSSRTHKDGLHPKKPPQDAIGFLAGLNVSMPQVATIAQEIIALYTLWARFREDGDGGASLPSSARAAFGATPARSSPLTNTPGKRPHTPAGGTDESGPVTPLSLVHTLARMREAHFERLVQAQIQYQLAQTPTTAHTPTGVHASGSTLGTSGMGRRIGVAVNKRLERAQAAG